MLKEIRIQKKNVYEEGKNLRASTPDKELQVQVTAGRRKTMLPRGWAPLLAVPVQTD